MSQLPQSMKIGPITYQVREEARTAVDGNYGVILYSDSIISLQPGLATGFQRIILFHEAVHAILSQAGYRDQDEQLVHAVAVGITQLLQDNPALVGAGE